MTPRRSLIATALLALLVTIPLTVLGAGTAVAHSSQITSTPDEGERLSVAPGRVIVTFDAPLMDVGAALVVSAPDGSPIAAGTAEIAANEISVPVRQDVPAGEYTVAYRVVSQDGHTVSSSYTYTVTAGASPSAVAVESAVPTAPTAPSTVTGTPAAEPLQAEEDASSAGPVIVVIAVALGLTVVAAGAIALRR